MFYIRNYGFGRKLLGKDFEVIPWHGRLLYGNNAPNDNGSLQNMSTLNSEQLALYISPGEDIYNDKEMNLVE